MLALGDLKKHQRILIDGDPWTVLEVHLQSSTARGSGSLTRIKMRNLRTAQVLEKTFRSGDKLEEPNVELRAVQFLYKDADGFHFMDTQSYDQFSLTAEDLGDSTGFLKDGMENLRSIVFNEKFISVDLPNTVVLQVTETAPAIALLKLLADKAYCRERLGRKEALGKIDSKKVNAWGGSLALGADYVV